MKFLSITAVAVAMAVAPAAADGCSWSKSETTAASAETHRYVYSEEETSSIVDVASAAGSFNTLLAAAEAAGLAETLATGGPFTVFAPTDAAFAALPEGTVESLLLPENQDQLAGILKLHVISGKVMSTDLAGQVIEAETLNGTVTVDGTDGVTVNGATVITADVSADNGVIHVIDAVLLP